MLFVLALSLTLLSAVCCNFSTPRAEPRLPAALGWALGAGPLLLAVATLAARMSTFTAILTVLTIWMIALPAVGVLRALRRVRTGRAHG
ncbi:hypothetical protein LXA47_30540 [Massilia sp. P8910]|uniref:hypothetical protein n=1 Tax=Massilia antarctica TaxID=2765360 RepID=UPI0006BB5F67|nr:MULTISPECIES: hypothetical protein [Massilia]MCE3607909.1 hypothetical protein [Massilia antarctica]MCY0914255.1 hypothetical protein [Massilia sp. H27-R4]CUI08666.1 hypothetical protein BN2497_12109 [Janthinobacterium sp. CG23_2]CUU32452.1 hypothetical protein BN3177_12109 [Janthinobacterium sp. CG23_2]